ncbi:hypothetical protein GCM10009078_17510 [Cupriavidus gilardii]
MVKPQGSSVQPDGLYNGVPMFVTDARHRYGSTTNMPCPYGRPGDRLWVRETWTQPVALDPGPTVYRADYPACVPAGFEIIPRGPSPRSEHPHAACPMSPRAGDHRRAR